MRDDTLARRLLARAGEWEGVTTEQTQRGATALVLDGRQLGHVHLDRGTLDFPLADDVKQEALGAGRVRPWRSGWVSKPLHTESDVEDALALLRTSYDREP